MIKSPQQKNKGFSLIETIFYLALFSLTAILVINAILVMFASFKEVAVNKDLSGGAKILEIISREIRNAETVQIVENASPFLRSLVLNGVDELGGVRIIRIDFTDNQILLYEDNGLIGNLNSDNLIINDLDYELIAFVKEENSISIAPLSPTIKIHLEVESNRFASSKSQVFDTSVISRQGY